MYAVPDGSGSQPGGRTPVLGKEERIRDARAAVPLSASPRSRRRRDDEALLGVVRDHLVREHPAIVPTDEWVIQVVATRSYQLEHAPVDVGGTVFEEEFGLSF